MIKINNVIFNDMKAEDFFKNKTVSYWDSHQFDNALTEEGEYMEIDDVKEYAKLYHQEQIKNNVDLANSLLKKYMSHVMDNEGVSFVENANDAWSNVKFTDNELEKLKAIDKEITNEY